MVKETVLGLAIPFIGTTLGAAMVYFLKKEINPKLQKALLGFASGVMIAASIWSLLLPALELSGQPKWLPAAAGFLLGMAFLLLIDSITPHQHLELDQPEGPKAHLGKSTMLVLAVTIHNIPEGMAVGVIFAGMLSGNGEISLSAAMALAIGIAIQNFPEGAIISLPLKETGLSKNQAFMKGMLSGIVEPIAAVITILLTNLVVPILPYLLSFAAGAMIYVVVEELIPEAQSGPHSNISTIGVAVGFVLMMVLDVALS